MDKEKEIDIVELRKLLLEVLNVFHNFCEEHDLKYSLCGGTLIGAVRHHGFIPWDDDVDVLMPIEDYKKFKELWKDTDDYKLYSMQMKGYNYKYPFYKLVITRTTGYSDTLIDTFGVFLDIFSSYPVDTRYFDKIQRKIDHTYKVIIPVIMRNYSSYRYGKSSFARVLLSKIHMAAKRTQRFFQEIRFCFYRLFKGDEFMKKYKGNDCHVCIWNYKRAPRYPISMYEKRILATFEGYKFYIPEEYDAYLSNQFGNYMELPPVEQRVSDHDYHYFKKS